MSRLNLQTLFFHSLLRNNIINKSVLSELESHHEKHQIIDILRLHGVKIGSVIKALKSFSYTRDLGINFHKPNTRSIKRPGFFEINSFMNQMKNGFVLERKLGSKIFVTKSINSVLSRERNIPVFFLEEKGFIYFIQRVFETHLAKFINYNPFTKKKAVIANVGFFIVFHLSLLASGWLSALYVAISCFKITLLIYGKVMLAKTKEARVAIKNPHSPLLPKLTILIPLYKETKTLHQLMKAIGRLNYPKALIDVKILIEKEDTLTKQAIKRIKIGRSHIITIPASKLKTKPRALNYGILFGDGSYCAIFDAEDIPCQAQILNAMRAFEKRKRKSGAFAIQGVLSFYNESRSMIAKMMNIEYRNLFCNLSPASARFDCFVPLGGTSNYCETKKLISIGGWNSYNVTEDFDLAIQALLNEEIIQTIYCGTQESCVTGLSQWIKQRTRWLKGFLISTSSKFLYINATLITKPIKLVSFYTLGWLNIAHPFFTFEILLNYKRNHYGATLALLAANSFIISWLGSRGKFFVKVYHSLAYLIYNLLFIVPAARALLEVFYKYSFWSKTEQRVCLSDQGQKQSKSKGQESSPKRYQSKH